MSGDSAKARMGRILRLHEEIDAIKADIKDIYAEEKADGGDKTAMGAAISIIRKREKDATAFDEQQGIVDVYLTAYLGTGTVVATHTHASETREERSKIRLSEAMDDNKALSADMLAEGLISPEAHAENVALSDAVAEKLGAGVTTFTPKPLRPYCLNTDKCGGQGRKHCWSCQKAHDEAQGAA